MLELILILIFGDTLAIAVILFCESRRFSKLRRLSEEVDTFRTQAYQYGAKINKLTEENEALSQYIALAVRNVKSLMKH